jgi:hypothetical protein
MLEWEGDMRALAVIVFLAAGLPPLLAESGHEWCHDNTKARQRLAELGVSLTQPVASSSRYSSFKGITLGITPGEAAATLFREGFDIWINTYIKPKDTVSSFEICHPRARELAGWVEFDQSGHAHRLTLQADYFFDKDIPLRDFADRVFQHYKVRRDEVADDACFQDVTCFRGRTAAGEQFLILRINGLTRLYVRPLRPGE